MAARSGTTENQGVVAEQARALGHRTRFAIFRYVDEAAGPVGVAELTSHFGFNHNAIRQHLAKLRDAGLVIEEVSAPSGPGRPSLRYRPNPGAAGRWGGATAYENLSSMLIDLLRSERTPYEVGRSAGQRMGREHGSDATAVEILEAIARRLGFEPRREQRRTRVDVVLERCPFVAQADVAPEIVCELHRGLADGIADVASGDVRVTGLTVQPAARAGCRIHLRLPRSA